MFPQPLRTASFSATAPNSKQHSAKLRRARPYLSYVMEQQTYEPRTLDERAHGLSHSGLLCVRPW